MLYTKPALRSAWVTTCVAVMFTEAPGNNVATVDGLIVSALASVTTISVTVTLPVLVSTISYVITSPTLSNVPA
ncbi:hypothetical protein D3C86_1773610 [compost metagenome]